MSVTRIAFGPRPHPRALPTVYAQSELAAAAEFVDQALRMRRASAASRVPFWDPRVFLSHRVAARLHHGAHPGDARLAPRKLATLLAWQQQPVVVNAPHERLVAAWSAPWVAHAPLEQLLALGPGGYFIALGPGFGPQGLQDERLDSWIEGLFVCLDEHDGSPRPQFELSVVQLAYDLREGLAETVACIPLDAGLSLGAARARRLAAVLAHDAAAAREVLALALADAMRVVTLLADLVVEVNHVAAGRRLAWARV